MTSKKRWAIFWSIFSLLCFAAAILFLAYFLRHHSWNEIAAAVKGIPLKTLGLTLGLVVLGFLMILPLDLAGLRYMGKQLQIRKIMVMAFVSNAFGRTLGLTFITSGGLRYRLYSAWGFTRLQSSQLIAFYFISLSLGFMVLAGLTLSYDPPSHLNISPAVLRAIGWGLIVPALGYVLLSFSGGREIRLFRFHLKTPSFGIALQQVFFSVLKWLLDIAALYFLLPAGRPEFLVFCALYFGAQVVSISSHAPGGLGVLDAALMLLLRSEIPAPDIAGSLLAFRLIYNILPFVLAVLVYAILERCNLLNVKGVKQT